jgi:hypothetical protein
VRLSVGKDPADASARRQRKEAELNAVNHGVSIVPDSRNVMKFLKAQGIRGLAGKNDWPRFTEEEPEIYEQEELRKLLAKYEERLWYEFFLMTGMREQEVMYTYWSDVNLAVSTVRVSHKPDRG